MYLVGPFVVNELAAEFLPQLEVDHSLGRHLDGLATAGIAALASPPIPETEASETTELDALSLVKGLNDTLQKRIHEEISVFFRELQLLHEMFGQIGLGEGLHHFHGQLLAGIMGKLTLSDPDPHIQVKG
jgi:hypothetical protein